MNLFSTAESFVMLWALFAGVGTAKGFAPRHVHKTAPTTVKVINGDGEGPVIHPVYEAKTISALDKYKKVHAESIANPAKYWGALAKQVLDWETPFDDDRVLQGDLVEGDVRNLKITRPTDIAVVMALLEEPAT